MSSVLASQTLLLSLRLLPCSTSLGLPACHSLLRQIMQVQASRFPRAPNSSC